MNPNTDIAKTIYNRFFKGKTHGRFIECGAIDGIHRSICKHLQDEYNWVGFNFEPNPYSFEKLKTNRPKDTNINAALSLEDGTLDFHIPNSKKRGKMNGGGTLVNNLRDDIDEVVKVKTIRFDTFIKTLDGDDYIDLMILDVEGHELSVIKAFKDSDSHPRVLCVEINKSNVKLIIKELKTIGYRPSDINVGINNKVFIK